MHGISVIRKPSMEEEMRVPGHEVLLSLLVFALLCFAVRTKSVENLALWLTRQCSKVTANQVWFGMMIGTFFIFEASIRAHI